MIEIKKGKKEEELNEIINKNIIFHNTLRKKIVISEKLKKLNIEIPNAPDPVGAYVAFKKSGNLSIL